MKAIIFGIAITAIGVGLIHRNHGKWYEYIAAIKLGSLAAIGVGFLTSNQTF